MNPVREDSIEPSSEKTDSKTLHSKEYFLKWSISMYIHRLGSMNILPYDYIAMLDLHTAFKDINPLQISDNLALNAKNILCNKTITSEYDDMCMVQRALQKTLRMDVPYKNLSFAQDLMIVSELGYGSYARVLSCKHRDLCINMAVKYHISDVYTEYGLSREFLLCQELYMGLCLNELRSECPNFIFTLGKFEAPRPWGSWSMESHLIKDLKIPDFRWRLNGKSDITYLLYEDLSPCENLFEWIMPSVHPEINVSDYRSLIYQIFLAMEIAHRRYSFTHYDLHTKNIMVKKLDVPQWIYYNVGTTVWKIFSRYIFIIIDIGMSYMNIDGIHYGSDKLGDFSRRNSYPIFDIYKLLGTISFDVIDPNVKKLLSFVFEYVFNEKAVKKILRNGSKMLEYVYELPIDKTLSKIKYIDVLEYLYEKDDKVPEVVKCSPSDISLISLKEKNPFWIIKKHSLDNEWANIPSPKDIEQILEELINHKNNEFPILILLNWVRLKDYLIKCQWDVNSSLHFEEKSKKESYMADIEQKLRSDIKTRLPIVREFIDSVKYIEHKHISNELSNVLLYIH